MSRGWPWVLIVLLSGCDEPQGTDDASSALPVTPATAAPTSTIRAPGDGYADADVPVAADFEEEVATSIDENNHLDELRALEEAIGGGPAAPTASAAAPAASSPPP